MGLSRLIVPVMIRGMTIDGSTGQGGEMWEISFKIFCARGAWCKLKDDISTAAFCLYYTGDKPSGTTLLPICAYMLVTMQINKNNATKCINHYCESYKE